VVNVKLPAVCASFSCLKRSINTLSMCCPGKPVRSDVEVAAIKLVIKYVYFDTTLQLASSLTFKKNLKISHNDVLMCSLLSQNGHAMLKKDLTWGP